jgi:CheY-like chemotaxis protein
VAPGCDPVAPRRILVVDDEPDMLINVIRMLRRGPYHCITAESGEQAVFLLQRYRPDLILTDLHLPGMDGLAVLRAARQLSPPTPVVICTASASADTARDALAARAVACLAMPFTGGQLRAAVGTALEGAGPGGQVAATAPAPRAGGRRTSPPPRARSSPRAAPGGRARSGS